LNSPTRRSTGKRIALTGGIATGKTTVANRLGELGAIIPDADEHARRAAEPGTTSYAALRVYSTREVPLERLMRRDGLPQCEAERTLSIQLPIDFQRDRSDYIIENSGEPAATLHQVDELWSRLLRP
jgi:dephospho-CoA kinase